MGLSIIILLSKYFRNAKVWYCIPVPDFLSSTTWPLMPKKHSKWINLSVCVSHYISCMSVCMELAWCRGSAMNCHVTARGLIPGGTV